VSRAAVLRALAEPRRREILELVRLQEMAVGDIAQHFDVTRGAVSQHLGILKTAGLLSERRDGKRHLYRVRLEGFADLQAFLDQFWDIRLARLKEAAESATKRAQGHRRQRGKGPG
jgi:DNA-binding transcriptional ArsR family regulator